MWNKILTAKQHEKHGGQESLRKAQTERNSYDDQMLLRRTWHPIVDVSSGQLVELYETVAAAQEKAV